MLLARLIKKKAERAQRNKIKNKTEVTIDIIVVQRIMRECYINNCTATDWTT